jgi:hypothetical protein
MKQKHTILSLLGAGSALALLCSCGSFQPDDRLQKVVSGDIFSGRPVNMQEERRLEQPVREEHLSLPDPHYSVDKETQDNTGQIGLKMPL